MMDITDVPEEFFFPGHKWPRKKVKTRTVGKRNWIDGATSRKIQTLEARVEDEHGQTYRVSWPTDIPKLVDDEQVACNFHKIAKTL